MGYKYMHFRFCTILWIKLHKKVVKWLLLGFEGITRFGSVIGILSYFSWQLHFPGASIKFQKISQISRSCRYPVLSQAQSVGKVNDMTFIFLHFEFSTCSTSIKQFYSFQQVCFNKLLLLLLLLLPPGGIVISCVCWLVCSLTSGHWPEVSCQLI